MKGRLLAGLAVNGVLLLAAFMALAPLAWMVSVSFMPAGASNTVPPPLLPHEPTLEHYRALFGRGGMGRTFINSLLIALATTLISTLFNTMAGYAFAKLQFRGREKLFSALLAALVIPGQVAMLPLFLMLKGMGLVNSYAGVLIPGLAGIFGIFLVRQYARNVPDELLEAARLDGAGEFRIFFSVVLPILAPVLVTLAVFSFLGSWNDFMWPLIVLTDSELHTLPVALASLSREHVQDNELMMAGAVVTVLPVLLLFLALQRYYMAGLTMGSVK
ncbi:carbohydrate ABC transporter permease [Ideonella sp. BN130291]|uniref:carbohydrate ABC transporter permease n=1 Tax=Ideonella sp. BN130291 TaxID=3112940 RepID=UPI002E276D27|nr:carbohydrate ABC transporter permease [Ideonella sp. BN130291]